jgi:adenylyltransferase and sulfurtransferase
MGVLQALETIKIIAPFNREPDYEPHEHQDTPMELDDLVSQAENGARKPVADPPSLLLFSAYNKPQFRTIRLRSRRPNCAACSNQASINASSLNSGSLDYVQFCGTVHPVGVLSRDERISAQNYARQYGSTHSSRSADEPAKDHVLVDVREKVQYDLCSIENAINIPFSELTATNSESEIKNLGWFQSLTQLPATTPIHVICRLGNDSQIAVKMFKRLKLDNNGRRYIGDITGGLKAWRQTVDPDFPDYG